MSHTMPVRQEILDRDGFADALAVLDLGYDVPRFEPVAMGSAPAARLICQPLRQHPTTRTH